MEDKKMVVFVQDSAIPEGLDPKDIIEKLSKEIQFKISLLLRVSPKDSGKRFIEFVLKELDKKAKYQIPVIISSSTLYNTDNDLDCVKIETAIAALKQEHKDLIYCTSSVFELENKSKLINYCFHKDLSVPRSVDMARNITFIYEKHIKGSE